jgi:hypothetical protein
MSGFGAPGVEAMQPAGERGLPRAFRRPWAPLWIAFVAWQWWDELGRRLASAGSADLPESSLRIVAVLGAAGHPAGNAIEALFYVSFWHARGIRLGFARLFEWLVTISVLDLAASWLTRVAESHPGWVASALKVFVGFGAVRGDVEGIGSGLRAAFGSAGLLCIARLVATAEIQRRGTGRGWAVPLGLTVTVWLLGRLASWWTTDLLRGMSPLP